MLKGQRVQVALYGEGEFVEINSVGRYRVKLDRPGVWEGAQRTMGGICFAPREVTEIVDKLGNQV